MIPPQALIFDFDGVLLESEMESSQSLAELLTEMGYPMTTEQALERFCGVAGENFIALIEAHMGRSPPAEFRERRKEEAQRAIRDGIDPVEGAVEFVRSLPAELPKAVASSSRVTWIQGHLENLGLRDAFGQHLYSGSEHVERGKPAPDVYLHAAAALGVPIAGCVILEDSEVGATAAVASGATVIGLVAGAHCLVDHPDRLRAKGVQHIATSFEEVRRLLRL